MAGFQGHQSLQVAVEYGDTSSTHLAFSPYLKNHWWLVKCKDLLRKVPLHLALADVVLHLQDPVNNSSIHIYMNPLMTTMLQGEPAKLCAKEQLCHNESLIFKRWTRGGSRGVWDCWIVGTFLHSILHSNQGPATGNVFASCSTTQSLVLLG